MINNIKKLLFRFGWITVCACITAFVVTALLVYNFAKPNGVSAVLPREQNADYEKMCNSLGNLEEASPHVTKVYEYVSNDESVHIRWENNEHHLKDKIVYGVVEDGSAEYNCRVEVFVYSDIVDKELIRRTWNFDVTEGSVLRFVEAESPYFYRQYIEYGDIKKSSYSQQDIDAMYGYSAFIRVIVKNEHNDVSVEIVNTPHYLY